MRAHVWQGFQRCHFCSVTSTTSVIMLHVMINHTGYQQQHQYQWCLSMSKASNHTFQGIFLLIILLFDISTKNKNSMKVRLYNLFNFEKFFHFASLQMCCMWSTSECYCGSLANYSNTKLSKWLEFTLDRLLICNAYRCGSRRWWSIIKVLKILFLI